MKKMCNTLLKVIAVSLIICLAIGIFYPVEEISDKEYDESINQSGSSENVKNEEGKNEQGKNEQGKGDLSANPDSKPIIENTSSATVDINALPNFSGKPYISLNNNIPSFNSEELTIIAYEKYSPLDRLGRCGIAIASCGKEIMPDDDDNRGSIGGIKPSGWIQASYSGISGGYLWNRCHLIGWQLSAENANERNLITGTRYMNLNGMLPFENMIASYIKATNNHVAVRVTPIFEGDNLVCNGVQIEGYSIEDNGEAICFNVYCYNVQPGIVIDYSTGASCSANTEELPSGGELDNDNNIEDDEKENDADSDVIMVWIPKTGTKYHTDSDCSNMNDPRQVTLEEAERQGFTPCKKCH